MNNAEDTSNIDYFTSTSENLFGINVKRTHIIIYTVLGLIIALLSGIPESAGHAFNVSRGMLIFLLFVSLVSPAKFGISLLLLLVLVCPDALQTSSAKAQVGVQAIASIWNLRRAFIRPSWLMTVCICVQIIKIMPRVFDKPVKRAIIWFATVPVIVAVFYGNIFDPYRSIEIPSDMRIAIVLTLNIVMFRSLFRKYPGSIALMFAVFLGGLLGRYAVDMIYWSIGYGATAAGVVRVSVDSTKSTVIFLLLFSIFLFIRRKRFVLSLIVGLSSCLLLIVFASRLNWVIAFVSCTALLYLLGAKRAVIALPLVAIIALGSLKVIGYFSPETTQFLAEKSETLVPAGDANYFAKLDPLRYGEIVNSTNTSMKRFSFLWGVGYGGYYTDTVIPFPRNLIDAFPEYSEYTGRFYWIHAGPFMMLFKYGLIGFTILSALWFLPAWRVYRLFDKNENSLFNGMVICLLAFVFVGYLNLWWSGKGLFINGFVIAALMSVVELYGEVETEISLPQVYPDQTYQQAVQTY